MSLEPGQLTVRQVGCYFGATIEQAMATSTTLKLPDDLKERVGQAAHAAGKSPHAFMVEAIELHTRLAERRQDFIQSALAAEQEVATYGLVYDGDEVLSYLKARFEGRKVARPRKRKR
jgi:predicted transcriptional regulator